MLLLLACAGTSTPLASPEVPEAAASTEAAELPAAESAPPPAVTAMPPTPPPGPRTMGQTIDTTIASEGIGSIAVRLTLPPEPRWEDGAGVVVEVGTFFTQDDRFYQSVRLEDLGLIHVSYLWPGVSADGQSSDGEWDHGGETAIAALRDVIRFAAGDLTDTQGRDLAAVAGVPVADMPVGMYAFSHPGLAAVTVLSLYGPQLSRVGWLVTRENPSMEAFSAVELGHFEGDERVLNPLYNYERDYQSTDIPIDYSSARFSTERDAPYFDIDGSGDISEGDYVLGKRQPRMFGKRYYSRQLTAAMAANGVPEGWPEDVATVEEANAVWPFRSNSVQRYASLAQAAPQLHVMIVFSERQHVQPLPDCPNIHQAWDGFRGAGLWTRINPDASYGAAVVPEVAWTERDANAEISSEQWADALSMGHPASVPGAGQRAAKAALAEMADRMKAEQWAPDLDAVLP